MIVKNVVSSLIGLSFLLTPCFFGMTDGQNVAYTCILLGGLQMLASLAALKPSAIRIWFNVLSLLAGAAFIIVPNTFHLNMLSLISYEILGLITIMLNYSIIYPESQ